MKEAAKRDLEVLPKFLDFFESREIFRVKKDEIIFHQGDQADALFYLIAGRIRYSVNTKDGKDAMLFVFSDGDFFGERCLTERRKRFGTACALTEAVVMRLDKREAQDRLLRDPAFGEFLFSRMLDRAHEYEEVLLLHLVTNSELRLASVLLRLAGYYVAHRLSPDPIRGISQTQLAEMVGTTRPRVNIFMNKFRRLKLIQYNDDEIVVKPGLIKMVEAGNTSILKDG